MGLLRGNDRHWIVVSLAGVAASFVPQARIEAIAEAARLDPSETHERLWASGFADRCCAGELGLAEMIAELRSRLGVDLTEAHLMGLWALAYEPDLDMLAELIEAKADTGCRIGVIADETPLFRAGFDAYVPEVEMLADTAWFSHEHHALTNDPRFYEAIAGGADLDTTTSTLVAASSEQSAAAEAAGWQVVSDLRSALSQ